MEIVHKIVDFARYCERCKYWYTKPEDEPCNECLTNPTNVNSQKPVNYKQAEDKK